MKTRRLGVVAMLAVAAVAVWMLAPGFATLLGRLIADLWVTVMSVVVGLFGGIF